MAQWMKNPHVMQEIQETGVQSLGWEISWRRKGQPTPVFLPAKSHGQRSLVGCSTKGHKEADMTEQQSTQLSTYSVSPLSM